MVSWSCTRRIFFLGAGSVLAIHFTLLYIFLKDQIIVQPAEDSPDPPYYHDEHSPLEDNPNTDWGPVLEPRLMRHLEEHRAEPLHDPGGVGANNHVQVLHDRGADPGYRTAPVGPPGSDNDDAQQPEGGGVNQENLQEQVIGVHQDKHTKLLDNPADPLADQHKAVQGGAGQGRGDSDKIQDDDHCFMGATPSDDIEEPLLWQEVVPGQAAVFSAYLTLRPAWSNNDSYEGWAGAWPSKRAGRELGQLVVIGVAGRRVVEEQTFHCQVWYRADGMHSRVVQATAMRLDSNTTLLESDVFFYCPVSPSLDPMAVSIINRRQCAQVPPNLLQIRNIDEAQARTRPVTNFTVCVPPLQARFSDMRALVETAELNLLLGAGRLVFYDQDTTDKAKDFYESYKREDSATVIPWNIIPPYHNGAYLESIHRSPKFAVLSALNDCLYRFKFSSRFIIFANIDEFIIPETVKNWEQLMMKLYSPKTSVYRFSRVPFTSQADARLYSAASAEVQFRLLSQLNTQRLPALPPGVRTGYMVTPTQIDVVGVHDVIMRTAGNTLDVAITDATLHDYLHTATQGGARGVEDRRALVYNTALKHRVAERHKLVRGRA